MTNRKNARPAKWYRTGKGRVAAWSAGGALAVGLILGAQAIADSRPAQHLMLLAAEGGMGELVPAQFEPVRGHGFGHGFGPGRPSPFADMTDEEMDRMAARFVAHAAIEIDATDEQRDEITAIVVALAGELRAVPDGFRDAGAEMRTLLLAEDVDPEALEALRAERIAEADRVSREVVGALTRVSGLLTPEQRITVAERMEMFQETRARRRAE